MFYISVFTTAQGREGKRREMVCDEKEGCLWKHTWEWERWGFLCSGACKEPSPDRGQHPEPLAAGLETALWRRTDICRYTLCRTHQLVFLGYRLQFHSLFSLHKPPPPWCSILFETRGEEVSKQRMTGKYMYTQARDCIHSAVNRLKRRTLHIWKKWFFFLTDEARLCLYCLRLPTSLDCLHFFVACVDSSPQFINAKIHRTHRRNLPTSPIYSVLLFFNRRNHKKTLGTFSWLLFLCLSHLFHVQSSKEHIICFSNFQFFMTLTLFTSPLDFP